MRAALLLAFAAIFGFVGQTSETFAQSGTFERQACAITEESTKPCRVEGMERKCPPSDDFFCTWVMKFPKRQAFVGSSPASPPGWKCSETKQLDNSADTAFFIYASKCSY